MDFSVQAQAFYHLNHTDQISLPTDSVLDVAHGDTTDRFKEGSTYYAIALSRLLSYPVVCHKSRVQTEVPNAYLRAPSRLQTPAPS